MTSSEQHQRSPNLRRLYHICLGVTILSLIILQLKGTVRFTDDFSLINTDTITSTLIAPDDVITARNEVASTNERMQKEDAIEARIEEARINERMKEEDAMKARMEEEDVVNARNGEAADNERMNILLLYADDWRHDTIGVAGDKVVHTPVIDKLSSEGIRFTHNCVTTSICWISRATLTTGQYLSRHKQVMLKEPLLYYENYWNETYPGLLRDRGYHTGQVGKWQFHKYPREEWDFSTSDEYGWHWREIAGKMIHVTQKNEYDALEFLRKRPKDKPFLLTTAFFAPHCVDGSPEQYYPQNETKKLYNDVNITIPLNGIDMDESWKRLPSFFTEENEARGRWHWRFDEPVKAETMMKNFYRMETEVDKACGNIIEELSRQGVLNKTLIIFTTDNGNMHGEHGLAGKWFPYQESIRVPLVIRDPRMPSKAHGSTNDDFTLNIDLASTIISAAGVEQPARMQGRDISELYLPSKRNKMLSDPWRKDFFYEFPVREDPFHIPSSNALIEKNFKYIEWLEFNVSQLFDLINDRFEENDLINDAKHSRRISKMKHRLKELAAAAL
mmetsp:Transcript_18710/g.22972  ORF Transcript_18710/g.22972 Transcript_18710/m.22972 type:complete len:560 (-) Transcript_18710:135-1814(-)